MQGHLRTRDSHRIDSRDQVRIEMQACGRRGDRTRHAREDALVTRDVGFIGGTVDVGRQRMRHAPRKTRAPRWASRSPRDHRHESTRAHHLNGSAVRGDDQPFAYRLAGAHLRQCPIRTDGALEKNLDPSAGRLGAVQARGDHARVIEDQQVAWTQQRWQVGEMPGPAGCRSLPSTDRSRLADRAGNGACAISSGGSS